MQKVVLAFDSFKGSVSASDITGALKEAILKEWPNCEVCSFPIADGGEGTVQVIEHCIPVTNYTCIVHGSLMEELSASYVVTHDRVAVIEMAAANGLPLLKPEQRNPLETSTLGTGELIVDALNHGCRNFIIGLGGSATNDAGIGVMHALGIRFLDCNGNILSPIGKNLGKIARIDRCNLRPEVHESKFILACDVTNPFWGPEGAAVVYAPQKGANKEQVEILDQGLKNYASLLSQETGIDISLLPGAGAAGGMGGGLCPLLHAELKSGIDIILDLLHFDDALIDADIVLTGEGKIDIQTGMGKALNGVLSRSKAAHIPIVGLGGCVEETDKLNSLGFTALFSIQAAPISLSQAMDKTNALKNLSRTTVQVLRLLDFCKKE